MLLKLRLALNLEPFQSATFYFRPDKSKHCPLPHSVWSQINRAVKGTSRNVTVPGVFECPFSIGKALLRQKILPTPSELL